MRISLRKLRNVPVETQSGNVLGHVTDVILQTEGQVVVQYVVKTKIIGGDLLFVSREQVVAIEEHRLVVDDAVDKLESGAVVKKPPVGSPEAVAMSEIE